MKINDAVEDFDTIQRMVRQGFLVRTRADAGTRESRANDTTTWDKALASGAHFISTDDPEADRRFSEYVSVQSSVYGLPEKSGGQAHVSATASKAHDSHNPPKNEPDSPILRENCDSCCERSRSCLATTLGLTSPGQWGKKLAFLDEEARPRFNVHEASQALSTPVEADQLPEAHGQFAKLLAFDELDSRFQTKLKHSWTHAYPQAVYSKRQVQSFAFPT